VIFSQQLENDTPAVAHLIYKPDANLIKQLESFIQQKVFIEGDDGSIAFVFSFFLWINF
jgi:hypothetical protein